MRLRTQERAICLRIDEALNESACLPPLAGRVRRQLCDAIGEYTKVLIEHRENVKTPTRCHQHNHELAKILGMESGTGLVVVAGRGKGPRTLFPEAVMPWTAAEIQQWMMGVFGKQTKFRTTDEL